MVLDVSFIINIGLKVSKKSTESAKKIEKRIIQSATKNFSKKGYANTSMNNIAESAKISKGGMYHYFSSKEELFLAVIFQDKETNLEKGSNLFKKREKLLNDLGTYYDVIVDKPLDLVRIWLEGEAEAMHNPKLKKMLQTGRRQVEEVSVGMLKQIKTNLDLLQDYSDSELPELSRGILNLYTGMTIDRIMEHGPHKLIRRSWIKSMFIILTSKK